MHRFYKYMHIKMKFFFDPTGGKGLRGQIPQGEFGARGPANTEYVDASVKTRLASGGRGKVHGLKNRSSFFSHGFKISRKVVRGQYGNKVLLLFWHMTCKTFLGKTALPFPPDFRLGHIQVQL